jgi:hypothetical protein
MSEFSKRCVDPGAEQTTEPPLHLELAREYAELIQAPSDPGAEHALREIDKLFDELLKIEVE